MIHLKSNRSRHVVKRIINGSPSELLNNWRLIKTLGTRKYWKNLKTDWKPPRNKIQVIVAKITQKQILSSFAWLLCLHQNIFWLHKKMKFSITDLFSKCDQISRKLRSWSHLLKKSLVENIFLCSVSSIVATRFWPDFPGLM